jgi:hypothetical protein
MRGVLDDTGKVVEENTVDFLELISSTSRGNILLCGTASFRSTLFHPDTLKVKHSRSVYYTPQPNATLGTVWLKEGAEPFRSPRCLVVEWEAESSN